MRWSLFSLLFTTASAFVMSAEVLTERQENVTTAAHADIQTQLRPQLSPGASITRDQSTAPRWSDYKAPRPGYIVNVATEDDVAKTVKYCSDRNIQFTAQSGSHGWATTYTIDGRDVIINMRGLRNIAFNTGASTVTIGGGTIISEVVAAADKAGYHVATGNCNCVGTMGAILGGGIGHLQGLYGLGVDQLTSMNVVLADGRLRTITPADTDLWWAMRGAAPNFGVVTSATLKAYRRADRSVWTGPLVFGEDKVEQLTATIDNLDLAEPMSIFLYYVTSGAPSFAPTILVAPFYAGSEADGRRAFKAILDIGPLQDNTTVLPYTQQNIANDPQCGKGGRKPSYGAGLKRLEPSAWRNVWNEYKNLVKDTRFGATSVFVECYSFKKARQIPDSSSSYAFRSTIDYTALVNHNYQDSSMDATAERFGQRVRQLWRDSAGISPSTYINFAFGDESLETVYGGNVGRLQRIKRQYDPNNRFDQWFPLQGSRQP